MTPMLTDRDPPARVSAVAREPAAAADAGAGVRILVYGLNFAPEPTGVGRYTGDMCARLVERGHEVAAVTGYPYYPHWRLPPDVPCRRWTRERWRGVVVTRCPLWVPRTPTSATRLVHLLSFALTSGLVTLITAVRFRPDIILVIEPTSFCAPAALLAGRLTGAKTWLHVQDIEFGAAERLGLLSGDTRRSRLFARAYGGLLRAFDRVTTLSERMRATLARLGRAEGAIELFPNWVDTEVVRPTDASGLREKHRIAPDDVVLLYAGNLGAKQGVGTLADVARHVARAEHIKLVIVGRGSHESELGEVQAENANAIVLPPVPEAQLPMLLSMADIHLLPQRADVTRFVFPSKLAPMLASGRPVIAQADPACAIRSVLDGCGLATTPDDSGAFLAAIDRLVAAPALRAVLGGNARKRAELLYGRAAVLDAADAALRHAVLTSSARCSQAVSVQSRDCREEQHPRRHRRRRVIKAAAP